MEDARQTAAYRILSDAGGSRYQFFCDASGALCCTTAPVRADTQPEELLLAWQQARPVFNLCRKCKHWVCDAMYNADVLECVDCAPWEGSPHYCSSCGSGIPEGDTFCRSCGARLQYREVWT